MREIKKLVGKHPTTNEEIEIFISAETSIASNGISAEEHILDMSGNAHGITIDTLGGVALNAFNDLEDTVDRLATGAIIFDANSHFGTLEEITTPEENRLYIIGLDFYMWIGDTWIPKGRVGIDATELVNRNELGVPNGVATLDTSGRLVQEPVLRDMFFTENEADIEHLRPGGVMFVSV